jgi:hypothetical protein
VNSKNSKVVGVGGSELAKVKNKTPDHLRTGLWLKALGLEHLFSAEWHDLTSIL